jgi:hypothetical protein
MEERSIPYTPHSYGSERKAREFGGHVCASFYPQMGMMRTMTEAQALLLLDPELLCVEGTFFCPENTAKTEYEFATCCHWTAASDLDDLFENPASDWLKDWQAEIWIPDGAAVADIQKVRFASIEIGRRAEQLCDGIDLEHDVVFEVDSRGFPQ